MDTVTQDIVLILEPYVPEIAPSVLAAMIDSIAPVHRTRRRLFIAISKRPGILTGEDPNVPVTVQALTAALREAGAVAIVVPGCESCGRKMQLPHRAPQGGRHCSRCEKNYRARPCVGCGQRRPIHKNLDGQYFCRPCWRLDPRSFGACHRCQETTSVKNALDGTLVCNRCYERPKADCFGCQRLQPIALHLQGKTICPKCYYGMRYPRPCPGCGEQKFLTHIVNDQLCCASCAGQPEVLACPGCGSVKNVRKFHLCIECHRPETIRTMLADADGAVRPELRPLEKYLLEGPARADSLMGWQYTNRVSAAVLRELATGQLPLEFEAIFTRCGGKQGATFLLSLLVTSGVLPDIDVNEERYYPWLTSWLSEQTNSTHRLLLRRYAQWGLSTKPWAGYAIRPTDPNNRFHRLRSRLQTCAEYLQFVEEQGYTTLTLPQRVLDAYVAGSANRHDHISHFTRWLKDNGLATAVSSYRPKREPVSSMPPDERWDLARWLLRDQTLEPQDRVAGLFVLLYGQPLTRIVAIPRTAVHFSKQGVSVTLADDPIELPEQLGHAVTLLYQNPPRTHRDINDTWIFPGRWPGRHLTAGALGSRLNRLGIPVNRSRSAALLELAAEIPVPLLSDLLGISTVSAAAWATAANRDWSTYPALRTKACPARYPPRN